MTLHVTHTFVSAKSDGADPTLVQPSNWNEEHVLAQLPGTVLGAIEGGSGETVELPISVSAAGDTIIQSTGFTRLAVGTTGQRPVSPSPGDERYNTTTSTKEYWNGSTWVQLRQTVPVGVRAGFTGLAASCPGGWVVADGNTIGNATSSATNRANADTQALFSLLFTDSTDGNLPLKTSGGVIIPRATYASAALAFAANTQMTVPNFIDRFGLGAGGAIAPLPSATGGAATQTLIEANLPPHKHAASDGSTGGSPVSTSGSVSAGSQTGSVGNLYTVSFTGAGAGVSTPFSILNSYASETPIIKL